MNKSIGNPCLALHNIQLTINSKPCSPNRWVPDGKKDSDYINTQTPGTKGCSQSSPLDGDISTNLRHKGHTSISVARISVCPRAQSHRCHHVAVHHCVTSHALYNQLPRITDVITATSEGHKLAQSVPRRSGNRFSCCARQQCINNFTR